MKRTATEKDVAAVAEFLKNKGLGTHISKGQDATIIGVIGDKSCLAQTPLEMLPGVEKAVPIMQSYKLASRAFAPEGRVCHVGEEEIGGKKLALIGGPCAVESEEQIFEAARGVAAAGARFLRGGAYKPRTSPYSFQGLEEKGLPLLRQAADAYGLKVVSEIISENLIESEGQYVDMFQVGARNMQNFRLLRELGRCKIPVLLKRGIASTIDEWLDAAEYIMAGGNYNVVLCERGIRTFETATRNTLDICAVPVVKERSNLPIIVDPSHAAGKAAYIRSLSLAGIAAGADGIIVEVHPDPMNAKSDAAQQIKPDAFCALAEDIRRIAPVLGREA